jgi:pyrroline-5-carboxylate reductase
MNSIGIIGFGTLGGALARGFHRVLPNIEIFATKRSGELPPFVTRCASSAEVVSRTATVLLCVKPQQAWTVLAEIAPSLTPAHQLISTCAALPLASLRSAVPQGVRVVRAMPNIACQFNEGITGVAFDEGAAEADRTAVLTLFAALGEVVGVDEAGFDAVTAIGGCGPAYVCVIIEALSDAGVKAGLRRDVSRKLALQTVLGSATMLRALDEHPAVIRDRVATPGGCTIDALVQLEEGRLRTTLINAVTAAAAKSAALSRLAQPPVRHVPPSAGERDALVAQPIGENVDFASVVDKLDGELPV